MVMVKNKEFKNHRDLLNHVHHDPVYIEHITNEIINKWDEDTENIYLGYSKEENNGAYMYWESFPEYIINFAIPHYEKYEKYEICSILLEILDLYQDRIDSSPESTML